MYHLKVFRTDCVFSKHRIFQGTTLFSFGDTGN